MIQHEWGEDSQRPECTLSKKFTSRADSDCFRSKEYPPFSSSRMNVYSVRKKSDEDLSKE
jgi:hypothetical protein